jgi:N-acetyl-anhydromuramyl-L-alanine amidase AmpD
LTAFFLFFLKSEKKVQFNKSQEEVTAENDRSLESDIPKDVPEDNPPVEVNNSPVAADNKPVPDDKNNLEIENKKSESNTPKITNKLVSWGYEKATSRKIDTIIIHSTYNITSSDPFDLNAIIYKEYKPYGVSPHYIINRDGEIYRLVEDKNIAYHAGESKMPDGRTGVNNFSIGIELVNSKDTKPTGEQYNSLKYLIGYLKGKYSIKYTLGHKDIASGRKDDPWNFDWGKIK